MTGTQFKRYHDEGHGFVECSRRFGFQPRRLGQGDQARLDYAVAPAPFDDRRRRYDWAEIQALLRRGRTYRQCKAKFGFYTALGRRQCDEARSGPATTAMTCSTSAELAIVALVEQGQAASSEGLLRDRCAQCGICEWRGKPPRRFTSTTSTAYTDDQRLENLRMLCPNCHSQTETYGGRNIKRAGLAEQGREILCSITAGCQSRLVQLVERQPLNRMSVVRVHPREPRPYRLEA